MWLRIRRVLRLASSYRLRITAGVLLSLAATGLSLGVPLGLRELLDSALTGRNTGTLNLLAALLLGLFACRAACGFAGNYLLAATGERVIADVRRRLYAHLHDLPLSFHGLWRTGDLVSRLTNDVAALKTAVTSGVPNLLSGGVTLIGSLALLIALSWRLTVLALIVVPAVALISRFFGRQLRRVSRHVQERTGDAAAIAEEVLSAMEIVKVFGRKDFEVERYNRTIEGLYAAGRRRVRALTTFTTVVTLLFSVAVALLFWYGGLLVLAGRISAGDLIASLLYAQNLSRAVGSISATYGTLTSAVGASDRLFQVLDAEPAPTVRCSTASPPVVRGHLRFDHVCFEYRPGVPVLRGVDFEVEPGKVVALVGPSGAGKSTVLKLIPRLYDPSAGRIVIDGRDLQSMHVRSLRERIAFVSQEIVLFDGTIRENIRYGRLDASDREVEAAARVADASGFIEACPAGFDTRIGQRGLRLSRGQRQRIAIARAVLRSSPVVLLDEPTASIDGETEHSIRDALHKLGRARTVIVVAHRLATIRNADRILVMGDGRIVESGTHDELLAGNGAYTRLVRSPLTAVAPSAS